MMGFLGVVFGRMGAMLIGGAGGSSGSGGGASTAGQLEWTVPMILRAS